MPPAHAAAGVAATERWDFGGRLYGLESLTLPFWRTHRAGPGERPETSNPTRVARPVELASTHDPGVEQFRFRWITGHQVSFLLWQLTGHALARVRDAEADREAVLERVSDLVRGYSLMLLYCGSCPREIYESTIRPSMRRQHPAFSGAWAPDYVAVRSLLRGRGLPTGNSPTSRRLRHEVELNRHVHDAVAAKLVPDSPSLLQAATVPLPNQHVLAALYDNYFLTLRAPASQHDLTSQLLRRLRAIAFDHARSRLPSVLAESDGVEPWRSAIRACEGELPELLTRIATHAEAGDAEGPG